MLGFGDWVVEGTCKHKFRKHITFEQNWSEFRGIARLHEGSMMLAKVDFSIGWISLDIKKIVCADD